MKPRRISAWKKRTVSGFVLPLFGFVALGGCTSAIRVDPSLPPTTTISTSPSRIGVYITHGPTNEVNLGSGIWPRTTYRFSAEDTVQEGLTELTRRHFRNAGIAENAGDKRWDYVLEYTCGKPYVDGGDLRTQASLKSTLRNPLTGRDVQTITLSGEGSPQKGRFFRILFGRLAEKGALERSLTEAYTGLYRAVDGNLARIEAEQSRTGPGKPYRKRDRPPS